MVNDDPIRADVERALHAIVGATIAPPVAIVGALQRCVARRAAALRDRVTRPARLARSLFDLAGGRVAAPAGANPSVPMPQVIDVKEAASAAAPSGVDDLPIEEYESLAASQVVARLPSLTADELGKVRRFEARTRGRRTVLGKIDQLLAT